MDDLILLYVVIVAYYDNTFADASDHGRVRSLLQFCYHGLLWILTILPSAHGVFDHGFNTYILVLLAM